MIKSAQSLFRVQEGASKVFETDEGEVGEELKGGGGGREGKLGGYKKCRDRGCWIVWRARPARGRFWRRTGA